ncbi:MAG: galactokinase family protein [Oscillospiraceae bacterium]
MVENFCKSLTEGLFDPQLIGLYGKARLANARSRYEKAVRAYQSLYGDGVFTVCSAPGRTELGGNHTDHNQGHVLAAAVHLDMLGICAARDDLLVNIFSEGFGEISADLSSLLPDEREFGTSQSVVRGVAAAIKERKLPIGGFNAYVTSDVLPGSGLSSSAAFEILIATIIKELYCPGGFDAKSAALFGKYAENNFFGKPSGLMDQMACSLGNIVALDFFDQNDTKDDIVRYSFEEHGYTLYVVDTRQSHQNLTAEYSSIPAEMKAVANLMGADVLAEADSSRLVEFVPQIRKMLGDRALLRAAHFFDEDRRAVEEAAALSALNLPRYFELVRESGISSHTLLQNVVCSGSILEQSLAVALYFTSQFLSGDGACRVHGGGFAGTIQSYIPNEKTAEYECLMESLFGKGCCIALSIRDCGGTKLDFRETL